MNSTRQEGISLSSRRNGMNSTQQEGYPLSCRMARTQQDKRGDPSRHVKWAGGEGPGVGVGLSRLARGGVHNKRDEEVWIPPRPVKNCD